MKGFSHLRGLSLWPTWKSGMLQIIIAAILELTQICDWVGKERRELPPSLSHSSLALSLSLTYSPVSLILSQNLFMYFGSLSLMSHSISHLLLSPSHSLSLYVSVSQFCSLTRSLISLSLHLSHVSLSPSVSCLSPSLPCLALCFSMSLSRLSLHVSLSL